MLIRLEYVQCTILKLILPFLQWLSVEFVFTSLYIYISFVICFWNYLFQLDFFLVSAICEIWFSKMISLVISVNIVVMNKMFETFSYAFSLFVVLLILERILHYVFQAIILSKYWCDLILIYLLYKDIIVFQQQKIKKIVFKIFISFTI